MTQQKKKRANPANGQQSTISLLDVAAAIKKAATDDDLRRDRTKRIPAVHNCFKKLHQLTTIEEEQRLIDQIFRSAFVELASRVRSIPDSAPGEYFQDFLLALQCILLADDRLVAAIRSFFVPDFLQMNFERCAEFREVRAYLSDGTCGQVDLVQLLVHLHSLLKGARYVATQVFTTNTPDGSLYRLLLPDPHVVHEKHIRATLQRILSELTNGRASNIGIWILAPRETLEAKGHKNLLDLEAELVGHGCQLLFIQRRDTDVAWFEKYFDLIYSKIAGDKHILERLGEPSELRQKLRALVKLARVSPKLFTVDGINFAFFPDLTTNGLAMGVFHSVDTFRWTHLRNSDTLALINRLHRCSELQALARDGLLMRPDSWTTTRDGGSQ